MARKTKEPLPKCPQCGSTNLRVNFEEMITNCDDCQLLILAIPRYPY